MEWRYGGYSGGIGAEGVESWWSDGRCRMDVLRAKNLSSLNIAIAFVRRIATIYQDKTLAFPISLAHVYPPQSDSITR